MNFKQVFRIVGFSLLLEGISLLPPLLVALIYREDPTPFLWTIIALAIIGVACVFLFRRNKNNQLLFVITKHCKKSIHKSPPKALLANLHIF